MDGKGRVSTAASHNFIIIILDIIIILEQNN